MDAGPFSLSLSLRWLVSGQSIRTLSSVHLVSSYEAMLPAGKGGPTNCTVVPWLRWLTYAAHRHTPISVRSRGKSVPWPWEQG
ncbi:hypothetical protein BO71DRAFT_399010 [Aspergillus ellipticus CBS 707.79]|uniref:Uncharacterized protein n=1 Tax=Aspergillus ellipticus CBS 707.79 TaxID=1448320 RepID=A0A319D9Z2_9EURO|nr:hypothetical protein BO71DRAFT_399010 [Aspergillus ellipticus CBS 707.79]